MNLSRGTISFPKYSLPVLFILILIPSSVIAPEILAMPSNPEGVIQQPAFVENSGKGFLLIIIDGVGRDIMLDSEYMPELNKKRNQFSTIEVYTGPLTLSANCVKELMTGVPNVPVDGLNNFDLKHPGGVDPWILASEDPRYQVSMIGSYVMGNMYSEFEKIRFVNTFQGHSDFYAGDKDTYDEFFSTFRNSSSNVMSVHFSGPDKVGHNWGKTSDEYLEKIRDIDLKIQAIVEEVGDEWNIVITADHGMTDIGTHGSAEPITREVAAFVRGPNIVSGVHTIATQRDLAALTTLLLDLPFPIQLHGRIPLDVINYNSVELVEIERWNWIAATSRVEHFDDSGELEVLSEDINWSQIPVDTKLVSSFSINLTVLLWFLIASLTILIFKDQFSGPRSLVLESLCFSGLVAVFVYSQFRLDYSAMIPRAFGAACVVYLVTWSLTNSTNCKHVGNGLNRWKSMITGPMIIPYLLTLLLLLTLDVSKSIVLGLMIWVIIYPMFSIFGHGEYGGIDNNSTGFYWIMAIACFTFSGIRLWFVLIPMTLLAIERTISLFRKKQFDTSFWGILILAVLLMMTLGFVHERIVGFHIMRFILTLGWPDDFLIASGAVMLLLGTGCLANFLGNQSFQIHEAIITMLSLFVTFLALVVESTTFDRLVILLILSGYLIHIVPKERFHILRNNFHLTRAVIPCHMLLVWGVWAAVIALILIPCVVYFIESISHTFDVSKTDLNNPKLFICMAVIPWMVWILWWTLMGQVNGIQTCFEGICPHPRELDLGRVIVKGGYVGFRENPPTTWMIVMVSLPVVSFSTSLLYSLCHAQISMKPYVIAQLLIVLGNISIISFSADSPRLLFSLIWNIVFACFQIIFAILAESIYMFNSKYLLRSEIAA